MFRRNLSVSGYRALVTWQPSPVLAVILYYNDHSWKFSHRSWATIGILPRRTPIKSTLLNVLLVRDSVRETIFLIHVGDVYYLTICRMRRGADPSCQCPVTIVRLAPTARPPPARKTLLHLLGMRRCQSWFSTCFQLALKVKEPDNSFAFDSRDYGIHCWHWKLQPRLFDYP